MELSVSEAGRALAAKRRFEVRSCQVCGKPFEGTVRRKFCSATCSQRAYYQRNAEKKRADQRVRYRLSRQGSVGTSNAEQSGDLDSGNPRSIRAARLVRGVTQRELAAKLGVAILDLRRWEHGDGEPTAAQWSQLHLLLA